MVLNRVGGVAVAAVGLNVPPVIVVEPLTPASDAVQLLARLDAVNASLPDALTFAILVELVADPLGPVVPWVLTSIGPELKRVAGPVDALPDGAVAVIGPSEPPEGGVTIGVGFAGLHGMPNAVTVQR